ncbi:hypothetical protein CYMTET_45681 [Cymbomonas tetramitiformis]|uniref:Hydroxylysine kinase n=1 Tax=Cymbomonas tetramitiformis TaxID=36881 RepID=A0AAE0EZG2_9CHLO|nr:hypothetical protein CYMTET_45681 [Cymbomonas tetramitiformis]
MSAEEAQRKLEKPVLDIAKATQVVESCYGLTVEKSTMKELNSYDDRNFFFRAADSRSQVADRRSQYGTGTHSYVIKFHNGVESLRPDLIQAQNEVMAQLEKNGLPVQQVMLEDSTQSRVSWVSLTLSDGKTIRDHAVRLFTYLEGSLLAETVQTPEVLYQTGQFIGRMDLALRSLHSPHSHALVREHLWDLKNSKCLSDFVHCVKDEGRRKLAISVLTEFEERVLPYAENLRTGVIHNDANDQNILYDRAGKKLVGILDFGDTLETWIVNEIAIAVAYIMLEKKDPLEAGARLLSGYIDHFPLNKLEVSLLPTLVACRLTCTCVMGAYSHQQEPDNDYLLLTQEPGWKALQEFRNAESSLLMEMTTCRFENIVGTSKYTAAAGIPAELVEQQ